MKVYVDGSNRGNPGIGGVGCVFYSDDGKVIKEVQKYIGDNITNNHAEYAAIIEAIKVLNKINKNNEKCTIYSDSKVVTNQINSGWKINYSHLRKLNKKVRDLQKKLLFDIEIIEIRRHQNERANDLAQDITAREKARKGVSNGGQKDSR